MKLIQPTALVLIALLALGGARCGQNATVNGSIEQTSIATGITYDNQPENSLEQVPASATAIYLSAEIANPTKSTTVQVAWYQLPTTVIASEEFSGKRESGGNNLDFDYTKSTSWLASRITRTGLSWSLGDYRVEVSLNGNIAKTLFFKVVSDSEAEKASVEKIVSALRVGDALDDDNQLVAAKTSLARGTDNIHIAVTLTGAKAGSNLEVGVRFVKTDLVINSFSSVVSGSKTLIFSLPRDRFGRLWTDKLWPVGSFEVTAKLNGVIARTTTFVVQP
ncbi:MAG: hypothetical protein WC553_00290 [Patescibacteria group bacterium]|jgi:hypothetical protein